MSNANEEFEVWRKTNFPAYTGDVFITGLTTAQWAYIDNERKAAYLAGHDSAIDKAAETIHKNYVHPDCKPIKELILKLKEKP